MWAQGQLRQDSDTGNVPAHPQLARKSLAPRSGTFLHWSPPTRQTKATAFIGADAQGGALGEGREQGEKTVGWGAFSSQLSGPTEILLQAAGTALSRAKWEKG